MKFGETIILKSKEFIKLIKIGCKNDKESYCVIGDVKTKHYDDYDDALEEFNFRWIKREYEDKY